MTGFFERIKGEDELRTVYREPSKGVIDKALPALDVHCRRFIELSPFLCIGTSRPDGAADVSPRGGENGFVHILDDTHLALPDRPGNNRLDTLTNIVHSPAVGLLFFIPGINEMLRVNGTATISTEPSLMEKFLVGGKPPLSVMVVTIHEAFLHCTKALVRSELWNPDRRIPRDVLPSFGKMIRDQLKLFVPAMLIEAGLKKDERDNLY